jgi:6,7-dimethyl-8-ribityllumazine synthase
VRAFGDDPHERMVGVLSAGATVTKGGLSFEGGLDGAGVRLAVVVARFNAHITGRLYEGCRDELAAHNVDTETLTSVEVPGCFELPLVAKALASTGRFDAVVCLGAVIRGDTPHFDYVSSETASGIQRAALDTGVPVVFGVLTTDNEEQAEERVGGSAGHKGREAALTAIEMVGTLRRLREQHGATTGPRSSAAARAEAR